MKKQLCANLQCKEFIEVPDDFEHEFCCNGDMCGCYGYPINPMFCESCEEKYYGTPVDTLQPKSEGGKAMSELKYCKHGIMKHMECHICQYESKVEQLREENRKLKSGIRQIAFGKVGNSDARYFARALLKEVGE